jgi:hypothetical protein
MEQKKADRRKHGRVFIKDPAKARIITGDEATLVDIGVGGVRMEHRRVLRPGSPFDVEFEVMGKRVRLRCRVVWSVVARQEVDRDGEGVMVYHTGLEFLDLSAPMQQQISEYVRSMLGQGRAVPSGNGTTVRRYLCEQCQGSFELADVEVRPVFVDPRKRPVRAGDLFTHAHGGCEGTVMCLSGEQAAPWSG